jgi:conjugative transfer signal peptidase TraF
MTRFLRCLSIASIALFMVTGICAAGGMRINTTRSIPVGMYWTTTAPISRDAYVMFCPPPAAVFETAKQRGYIDAGDCPGGYGYMMKRVLGMPGDEISVRADGVRVNGEYLPSSLPLPADRGGRPLPKYAFERKLEAAELWLMSDRSARSFDARYFGPIQRTQVASVIRPVVTW